MVFILHGLKNQIVLKRLPGPAKNHGYFAEVFGTTQSPLLPSDSIYHSSSYRLFLETCCLLTRHKGRAHEKWKGWACKLISRSDVLTEIFNPPPRGRGPRLDEGTRRSSQACTCHDPFDALSGHDLQLLQTPPAKFLRRHVLDRNQRIALIDPVSLLSPNMLKTFRQLFFLFGWLLLTKQDKVWPSSSIFLHGYLKTILSNMVKGLFIS